MGKAKKEGKRGVRISLALKIGMMSILPVILLAVILTVVGINNIRTGMRSEVMDGLEIQLESFKTMVESKDSGDYTLDENNNVLKGSYNITADVETFDDMVSETGLGVTIFYDKTRRATTLKDSQTGERLIGTDASDEVYNTVVKEGKTFESYDVVINGEQYFAYYAPLKNNDGSTVGMLFAGKPQKDVSEFITGKSTIMFGVSVVAAIVMIVLVIIFVASVRRAINATSNVVHVLGSGDLRADIDGKLLKRSDELGDMAREVSVLSNQLLSVMTKVNETAGVLMDAGKDLSNMASQTSSTADEIGHAVEDISKGAVSQAEEIETASVNMEEMGGVIGRIVDRVSTLDNTSDRMKSAGDSSSDIINKLSQSNDRTMDAIRRIGEQVNATNESANMISEAIQLITSIAEETNLLSLNASIEAARAGEQGKGFAVVANQIQKLAEQSNESAQKVGEIIANLLKDSEKTVEVMDEVRVIVNEQQEKLNQTRSEFSNVQNGIYSSREETSSIKDQTNVCDDARVKVVDVISNLSAISEENAAATQQTTASMQELNATINLLAESAGNLTDLSDALENEIKFFKL